MSKKRTLLRSLAYQWFRGPASRDRDAIVLDGRRADRYHPEAHPHIGFDLAKIKTPDHAVAFVAKYGLLHQPSGVLVAEGEPCPADVREPFANFETAADDLRRIVRTVMDVRKGVDGDHQALDRLRTSFGPIDPDSDQFIDTATGRITQKARQVWPADSPAFATDDRTMLIRASDWAAQGLSNGMGNAHLYAYEPAQLFPDPAIRPGGIRIGAIGASLLDYCYLSIARILATEPIATCEECQCAFVVEDGRQIFCDRQCANRARFRRYKNRAAERLAAKNTTTKKTTTKGSKHGKTTRTR